MIAEKVIGHLHHTEKEIDRVKIEWFERSRKRMRKTSEKGREIGICVDTPLNDGDILYEDDNTVIAVEIAECKLIKIAVSEMEEMGKLCFEIGNRHISLIIKNDCVIIPFDAPTLDYLTKPGFHTETTVGKFIGCTECRGHSHEH